MREASCWMLFSQRKYTEAEKEGQIDIILQGISAPLRNFILHNFIPRRDGPRILLDRQLSECNLLLHRSVILRAVGGSMIVEWSVERLKKSRLGIDFDLLYNFIDGSRVS